MRFINLVETKKELATSLATHFMDLALKNNLIGCYKTIVKKLAIYEEQKFLVPRDQQQESSAKAVVDLKKHIVSLETNRSSGKEQSLARLNLANILTAFGEYDEADEQLKRIKDLNELEMDQYYPLWVRINTLGMNLDRSRALVLKITESNQNNSEIRRYMIAQDLREVQEGKAGVLNNIAGLGLKSTQLKNDYITEAELG